MPLYIIKDAIANQA